MDEQGRYLEGAVREHAVLGHRLLRDVAGRLVAVLRLRNAKGVVFAHARVVVRAKGCRLAQLRTNRTKVPAVRHPIHTYARNLMPVGHCHCQRQRTP